MLQQQFNQKLPSSFSDILNGANVNINISNIQQILNLANYSKINVSTDNLLSLTQPNQISALNISLNLAQNFTVIEGFE
jgi:hypothetical protein